MLIQYCSDTELTSEALRIFKVARVQGLGADAVVELERVNEPFEDTLVLSTKFDKGIRTLTVGQIPYAGHSVQVLARSLQLAAGEAKRPAHNPKYTVITDESWFDQAKPRPDAPLVFDLETSGDIKNEDTYRDVDILCLGLTYGDHVYIFKLDDYTKAAEWLAKHNKVFGHNLRFDQRVLWNRTGVTVPLWGDTQLMHHAMFHGASGFHDLKTCAQFYLGAPEWERAKAKYTKKGAHFELIPEPILHEYLANDVYWNFHLYEYLTTLMDDQTWKAYAHEIEMSALYLDVERNGFALDVEYTNALDTELLVEEMEIKALLPVENPNSPVQIKKAFEAMGLNLPKTDKKTLTSLNPANLTEEQASFVDNLNRYRKVSKGRSAFTQSALKWERGGIVYPLYSVHGTKTGRLSSNSPNIHQVPRDVRYRRMWTVRDPKNVIVACDYSQIELRVMAILSQDKYLQSLINSDVDFFDGVMPTYFPEVDMSVLSAAERKEYRTTAKTIQYGLSFGRGIPAIAQALGVSVEYAATIINNFLTAAHALDAWRHSIVEAVTEYDLEARDKLLCNPFGRRFSMTVPSGHNLHSLQRSALSFMPQSTASDVCARAGMRVNSWIHEYGGMLVAHVHDSLEVEVAEEHSQEVARRMLETMESTAREYLGDFVKLEADVEISKNWGMAEDEQIEYNFEEGE